MEKNVFEINSKGINSLVHQVSVAIKPLQDTINKIYNNETIKNLSQILLSFSKILEKQNEIIVKTAESIRVNWLNDISIILNNTLVSLNRFPDFNIIEVGMNLQNVLARDTAYLIRNSNETYNSEAFDDSIPVKINKCALEICDIISKISMIDSKMHKRTSSIYKNIGNISCNIASDEKILSSIVNSCYEVFYEGFGKDNMRTDELVPFDSFPALIDIKTLRLFYDHDFEHGSEKKIVDNKEKIMKIFMKFIGKKLPSCVKDYKMCQYKLYLEIKEWLLAILDKINL